MKKISNQGFTLVELLISVGLISVILVVSIQFLLNLVSNSVRIQNRIDVEQNANFISAKITKLISDANSATLNSSSKVTFITNGVTYALELKNGVLYLQNTLDTSVLASPLNDSSIIISGVNTIPFELSTTTNPQQLKMKLKFEIGSGTNLGASQNIEKIITIRKSYKN
jgi:prepilin-type N-terminal cleavage/methylation domain-containing protein